MRKIAFVFIQTLFLVGAIKSNAAPKDVVSLFGQYLSSWCKTDDVQYRDKIERLCSGVKSCRVEDKIHADYQRNRGYMDYETYFLDSYLNMFQTLIPSGVKYSLSNIVVETQDQYPDGQVLTFITADVKVSGKINQIAKDLFLVRDNKISGIYHYSSKYGFEHLNGSLIAELKRGQYVDCINQSEYPQLRCRGGQIALIDLKGRILCPQYDNTWDAIEIEKTANDRMFTKAYYGVSSRAYSDVIYEVKKNGSNKVPFEFFGYSYDNSICEEDYKLNRSQNTVCGFVDGYAVVGKYLAGREKYGYLKDNDFQYNIDFAYDNATHFYKGLAKVVKDGVCMIIDNKFNVIVKAPYGYEIPDRFYFDSSQVIIKNKSTKLEGVMNFYGDITIPCRYQTLESLHDGLAAAKFKDKVGFIDAGGAIKVPFIYSSVYYYKNGVCWASLDKDDTDSWIYNNSYKKWELIDKKGTALIKDVYVEFDYLYPNTYDDFMRQDFFRVYRVQNDQTKIYALIDHTGSTLSGFNWNYNFLGPDSTDKLIRIEVNGMYGFANTLGEIVINPTYNMAGDFLNGCAIIGKEIEGEMKYGLISKTGFVLIRPQYEKIGRDKKGIYCSVGRRINGKMKYGAVDNRGYSVIPFKYDILPEYYDLNTPIDFNGNVRVCEIKNHEERYGYVNSNGTLVVPCIYENELIFINGVALAVKEGKVGLVDMFGNSYFF